MPELRAVIKEVFQLGSARAGVLDMPRPLWPAPGQYLPAQRLSGEPEVLATALFRIGENLDLLEVGTLPGLWAPGDELMLLPAQGKGFTLPPYASRVALVALEVPPFRLLPLIPLALAQGAAVTLFSDPAPNPEVLQWVPASVEVGPVSALLTDITWPDYMALDLPLTALPRLEALFQGNGQSLPGQVLLRTDMPCHGVGDCQVCAVKTQRGWRKTCQDGPVFSLAEVCHVV